MKKQFDTNGEILIHGYGVHYFLQKASNGRYNISYFFDNKGFRNLVQVNNYIESICDKEPLWEKM